MRQNAVHLTLGHKTNKRGVHGTRLEVDKMLEDSGFANDQLFIIVAVRWVDRLPDTEGFGGIDVKYAERFIHWSC